MNKKKRAAKRRMNRKKIMSKIENLEINGKLREKQKMLTKQVVLRQSGYIFFFFFAIHLVAVSRLRLRFMIQYDCMNNEIANEISSKEKRRKKTKPIATTAVYLCFYCMSESIFLSVEKQMLQTSQRSQYTLI